MADCIRLIKSRGGLQNVSRNFKVYETDTVERVVHEITSKSDVEYDRYEVFARKLGQQAAAYPWQRTAHVFFVARTKRATESFLNCLAILDAEVEGHRFLAVYDSGASKVIKTRSQAVSGGRVPVSIHLVEFCE